MRAYVLKRLLLFIPTVIGTSLLIFVILRIMPGDIATALLRGQDPDAAYTEEQRQEVIQKFKLDRPFYIQYGEWVWGIVRFDLGRSWVTDRSIAASLKGQIPVSLQLALFGAVLVLVFAIPVGVLAAIQQDKWPDYILRSIAILGLAMPTFFVGILVVILLSSFFRWLPPLGFVNLWDHPWNSARQLFFPALALAFHSSGTLLRMTRAQMLEVLREDYVRTARAKGLAEHVVYTRHALRNALLPVVTVFGFTLAFMLGGIVVIELIFNLPGLGQQLISAVFTRDFPVVQTYVLYLVLISLIVNLLVDLTYAWLDPRVQYE